MNKTLARAHYQRYARHRRRCDRTKNKSLHAVKRVLRAYLVTRGVRHVRMHAATKMERHCSDDRGNESFESKRTVKRTEKNGTAEVQRSTHRPEETLEVLIPRAR